MTASEAADPDRCVVKSRGIAVELARGARLRAWTALVVCLGLSGAFSVVYPAFMPLALLASLTIGVGIAASRAGRTARRRRRDAPGVIRVGESAIHVEAGPLRTRYDREDLLDGWLESVDDTHRVVLRMRSGDVLDACVADADEGNVLLHAAGVAPEQQTFRLRLVSEAAAASPRIWFLTAWRFVVTLLATATFATVAGSMVADLFAGKPPAIGNAAGVASIMVIGALWVAYYLRALARPHVVVGADGVMLRRLGRKRFFPYAQVEAVEARPNGVLLRAGPPSAAVLLATSPGRTVGETSPPEIARREVLHRRIKDALEASRRDPSASGAELLDRRERPFAEWRQAITRLVREGTGYRRTGIDPALLEQVLESAGAPAERRIGAAVALASSGDADQKARVRIAAEACANDKLRIALEQAAEGELEEAHLEEAIRAEQGA